MLGDKGVREYVAAAEVMRRLESSVECHFVGETDDNPDAIPDTEVRAWQREQNVVWHGQVADVRPLLAHAHVFVLPSYREGTSRSTLEAMSSGRPIITTDAPGCRETVIDGENGFLVEVGSVQSLVTAMRRFVRDPSILERFGRRSREIVEDRYEVAGVNAVMLRVMGLCVEADV
jgi:glycosyltransferase involved in cell wall biosynthesis